MHVTSHQIVAVVASLIFYSGWLHAASFDCRQASQPIEKTICSNPELSSLDEALATAYKSAQANSDNSQKLVADQRKWLRETRNPCQSSLCLVDAYKQRIAALTSSGPAPGASPSASIPDASPAPPVPSPPTASRPSPAPSGPGNECASPDPNNFDQVFACISSRRHGEGPSVFVNRAFTSCYSVASSYHDALRKGQPSRQQLSKEEIALLSPSCDMLAKAMQALKGTTPFWSACTNYPGKFDVDHLKTCLNQFLPGYYGGKKSLESLNGCKDVREQYQLALRSARKELVSTTRGNREFHNWSDALPSSYEEPDCTVVASLLGGKEPQSASASAAPTGKGAECLGYQADVAHLGKCLGADSIRLTTCVEMRNAYEAKLKQAYGGPFPTGYKPLTCDQFAPLVAEAVANRERLKAQADAAARRAENEQRALMAQRQGQQWGSFGSNSNSNGWIGWILRYLGQPFLYGLIVHGVVVLGALIYASRRARSGSWIYAITAMTGVFTRTFAAQMIGVHTILMAIGVYMTAWPWAIGAITAIIAGRILAFVMWMFGMFRTPPVTAGRVGGGEVYGPRPVGNDPGHTAQW